MLEAACTSPMRRAGPVVSPQSAAPLRAVGTALSTPHATSCVAARRARAPTHEVEGERRRPEPDGQVGEQWVQRMAEPHSAEDVLRGLAVERVADCIGDGIGNLVDALVGGESFDGTRKSLTEAHG